mmetsp:Transcript_19017/g.26527  ORF Transcript_19017/g.26527 Transcript_19017/m.26527 type:complete len:142 (-) Transcript_19017:407-832(-)|eukprot:CAMPEP_0184479892 /NCGR_PEP_ID=MMETSP0113_2-20130426/1430_1 /TAXON_ID=91329 /ORGANISM="Norrisiella sphaerica, Strain BC52" /LENGTH=141 /DNA_ID=CAMNT_0026858055 /DNA_START=118 /DNA_END=543 /DNA_ORIENTATION=+
MSRPPQDLTVIDDDVAESDVSDDEDLNAIVHPSSFVDYLYFRYEPTFNSLMQKYGPALNKGYNYAALSGLLVRKGAWKVVTSFIIYALPLMIVSERQQIWDAQKKSSVAEAVASMETAPKAGASASAGSDPPIKMIPPPSS